MHVNKAVVLSINDAGLLKENAKKLGLSESSFIKLCILIGTRELGLSGEYSFKYSYLKWYKPDDLIKEIKEIIGSEEKVAQKEDKVVKKEQDLNEKSEKKEVRRPKIQL